MRTVRTDDLDEATSRWPMRRPKKVAEANADCIRKRVRIAQAEVPLAAFDRADVCTDGVLPCARGPPARAPRRDAVTRAPPPNVRRRRSGRGVDRLGTTCRLEVVMPRSRQNPVASRRGSTTWGARAATLDMREAAAYLSVSPRWLQRRLADGRIPHVRLGRCVRFTKEQLDQIIAEDQRAVGAASNPGRTGPEKRSVRKVGNRARPPRRLAGD